MAESSQQQPNLLQKLTEAGKKAFQPDTDEASREAGLAEYSDLIAQ
jgi:hypothetical protein